jgi:hypothetical protein
MLHIFYTLRIKRIRKKYNYKEKERLHLKKFNTRKFRIGEIKK